jgi:hypothetical protein
MKRALIPDPGVGGEDRNVCGPQGRKPDDERHRLRRGRGNLQSKLSVTESLIAHQINKIVLLSFLFDECMSVDFLSILLYNTTPRKPVKNRAYFYER